MKQNWLKNFKYRILGGWTFMRFLRLALGLLISIEAIKGTDFLLGMLGGILLLQAFFNTGCCGSYACDTNHSYDKLASVDKTLENVSFKELK